MKPEDVLSYLQQHPQFFEDHAQAVSEILIPHPHGGRTISISERQILTLREKGKQLECKLSEVIRFGEENDSISEKVHRLAIALIGAADFASAAHAIEFNLREDFAVPHVALQCWRAGAGQTVASAATMDFAASLTHPYCCAQAMVDTAAMFGEAASHLRSFAYMALRDAETFGLLALASEDPKRFYPEMGTMYLKRIGDLSAAALARHASDG